MNTITRRAALAGIATAPIAAAEATYAPFDKRLCEWTKPATSRAGALAALRLAAQEAANYSGSPIESRMVEAALAYFEGERT